MLHNLKFALIVVLTSPSILYLSLSQETFISQNVDSNVTILFSSGFINKEEKFCCGQQQQNCTFDESYSKCHKDYVNCTINHSKEVIDATERCDGIRNCVDGSDESNCDTCTGPSFHCSYHRLCIKIDKRCNREVNDCPNNEDEANCSLSWISYPSPTYATLQILFMGRIAAVTAEGNRVYIIRMMINGSYFVGSYQKSMVSVFDGIKEHRITNEEGGRFELFLDPDRTSEWVWSSRGIEVLNGIEGGHGQDGKKTYIGRYGGDNEIVVGTVIPSEGGLVVSRGGKKEIIRQYEVLAMKAKDFECQNGRTIPSKDLCNCFDNCGNRLEELNCHYDGTTKFPCKNHDILQRSINSLVQFIPFRVQFTNNKTEYYEHWGPCKILEDENIKSVDTGRTCKRLYKDMECRGESIAFYPRSPFPALKERQFQRLPDDFGGKILSVGPCFENEFDRSIFEWNGTTIVKFNKIPFYQKNDQAQIHFVPDRVFRIPPPDNITDDGFQFKLGHKKRVEFVSGLFYVADVAPQGRSFPRIINQRKQEENYNGMDVTPEDQMKFYFTDRLLVPEILWSILIFPATKEMGSQILDLEQQIFSFLNVNGDSKVRVEISPNYNDLNSTRPNGLVYAVIRYKFPVGVVDLNYYLNNLHLQGLKPSNENRSEGYSDQESKKEVSGSDGTASVIGAGVTILIILIIGIVCWLKIRRKLHVLGKLTPEEIENFLHGKAAVDPNDLNGSVNAQPFPSEFHIERRDLVLDERQILGSGHYGVVYLGSLQREIRYVLQPCEGNVQIGDLKVAVKTLKQNAEMSHFRALLSEVKIMAFIGHHENIIQFYGACTDNIREREILVAVEYCEKGDLLKYLKQLRNDGSSSYLEFEETSTSPKVFESTVEATDNIEISVVPQLLNFSKQIAEAMAYLSSKKIIHGDLACRNVLLTNHGVVKVSDFGLSRQLFHYANYVKKQKMPLPWKHMAYESLRFMEFSIESDCWSYGVTLFEIFSLGGVPYPQFRWDDSFMEQIAAGYRIPKPDQATHQIYQIMLDCWSLAKQDRPSFSDIVQRLEDLVVK